MGVNEKCGIFVRRNCYCITFIGNRILAGSLRANDRYLDAIIKEIIDKYLVGSKNCSVFICKFIFHLSPLNALIIISHEFDSCEYQYIVILSSRAYVDGSIRISYLMES